MEEIKVKTKDKILDKSLDLFSKFGYADVSMEKIAGEVGIKAPSIYKHFKSKEEIFNSLLDIAIIKIDQRLDNMDDCFIIRDGKKSLNFEKLGIEIFSYLLHDPYVSKVRKMISIEMYKNPEAMKIYVDKFIENPISKHEKTIESLGIKNSKDKKVLSVIFYSPILLAVKLYDSDESLEKELLDLLQNTYQRLESLL